MTINGPAPMILAFFMNAAIDQQVDKYQEEHNNEPSAETYQNIRNEVLANVRGTVQADILKEDQAQNTCIFSTEFSLKIMGDVQAYFIRHQVKNFYSVSISGRFSSSSASLAVKPSFLSLISGLSLAEVSVPAITEAYLPRGIASSVLFSSARS